MLTPRRFNVPYKMVPCAQEKDKLRPEGQRPQRRCCVQDQRVLESKGAECMGPWPLSHCTPLSHLAPVWLCGSIEALCPLWVQQSLVTVLLLGAGLPCSCALLRHRALYPCMALQPCTLPLSRLKSRSSLKPAPGTSVNHPLPSQPKPLI